ncbi:chaB [Orgyia pseudotsugata single capsid nuclopolyhedrovirus]|nr:chaB [Orgyia pseudotsugata single capsid nuclopolyhedrovirus]
MPYNNISELPASVKNTLPAKAQRMYMHVYNSGISRYDNPARVAWGVVSKYYERPDVRGRKWTRRPHTRKSDDDDDIEDYVTAAAIKDFVIDYIDDDDDDDYDDYETDYDDDDTTDDYETDYDDTTDDDNDDDNY